MRSMKALVTGAAGFIGSHLVDRLIKNNFEVVGIDNLSNGREENVNPKCDFHFMDIRDEKIESLFQDVDFVFHQAAMGSVPKSFEFPDEYKSVNVDGFYNVLRAAENAEVRKFIYASSSSVYGDNLNLPKKEFEIGKQLSPYSFTKRVNELMCEPTFIPTVGLRYFNVFGPRQRHDSMYSAVVPRWISAMSAKRTITIHGDGSAFRDFTYVDNVVSANILAALTFTPSRSEVYNVGTGKYTLLNELVAHIRNGLSLEKHDVRVEWNTLKKMPITQSLASIERIKSHLNYKVEVGMAEGIKRTCDYYRLNI